ncbi:MAG: DinB family protein [Planctomycetota bacterium]|jgi:uncharacterized damage-inducible protein DinB
MDGGSIARQLGTAAGAAQMNIRGLSHEDSVRAPAGGGNCVNWVLGHMLAVRCHALRMLELELPIAEERLAGYVRGSEPGAAENAENMEWIDFRELRKAYVASQKAIAKRLEEMGADELDRKLAEPTKLTGDTLGSAMMFFAFHDAYHAGQLGILRRALGQPGAI